MKKNYSLILRKIIFAFNSISVIGIAIFLLYAEKNLLGKIQEYII